MLYEYRVDVTHRVVRVRLSGVLTPAALLSTFTDVQRDARVTHEFCALIDLRDIQSADGLYYDEVRAIASSPLDTVARRAFVAVHPAVFGICRMFATCREAAGQEPVAVFRSVHDAEDWLGLPPPEDVEDDRFDAVRDDAATVSSAAAHTHVRKFWQSTNVCCCLVSKKNPSKHWVQVCVDDKPFLEERVKDPDQGTTVAEKFWTQYADANKKRRPERHTP